MPKSHASNELSDLIARLKLDINHSEFGTDKDSLHSYTYNFYTSLFEKLEKVESVLEIGIRGGASCVLWKVKFPGARVIGVDISLKELHPLAKEMIKNGELTFIELDGYSDELFSRLDSPFDLIIDDGPHTLESQKKALRFREKLSREGVLVIEDIQNGILDFYRLKKALPSHERMNCTWLSFANATSRYDDAVFVYCKNQTTRKFLEQRGRDFQYWGTKHILFHIPFKWWLRVRNPRKVYSSLKRRLGRKAV